MREFKSLNPEKLPDGFDAEIHGEEPIVKVEESKGRIIVSYSFPGFYLSDDDLAVEGKKVSFKQANIAGTGFLAESGKPLLPSFGRYVQIPFNCDFKFKVEKGKPVQFDNILVSPAQEKLTDNPEEKHVLEYDKKIYAKDALYPEEIVKITGPFNIDDYCALLVHVCPFQHNPVKRKLIGYGNITLTINVTLKEAEERDYPLGDPGLNREGFGNLFLNPKRRIEERLEISLGKIVFPPFGKRGPEFLIIYYEGFKQAAEKLAEWKNMRGLRTEIVSIDTVGNNKDDIKTHIRNKRKYIFSRLRYVLLFGDVDMIEPETIDTGPFIDLGYYTEKVTDYYYSTSEDPAGSHDYVLPWLSIGRIPVRTLEEAIGVVGQIISYEKNPPIDSDYYERMAFGAYFQDDFEQIKPPPNPPEQDERADRAYMKTMEDIRKYMITLGFSVERIYVSNNPNPEEYKDGTPVPQEVKDAIVDGNTATDMLVDATSEGQLNIGHRDHGGSDGWSHPPFTINHLDNVTGEVPTMFYSVNCLTGKFDLTAPTECFAENIMRREGGAPSLIAATRVSETYRNDSMIKALFDAVWGGFLKTFGPATASYSVRHNRLGDVLNYAKSYLTVAHTGSYGTKDHFEIYHVVGDPTLELWKNEPLKVKIWTLLTNGYLHIRLSSCPKDSVITVWYGGKMLKRLEPSSTNIKIALKELVPLPGLPSRSIRVGPVCFWAPGYRFCQVKPGWI